MKASDSVKSIEQYSSHKDLNTVKICIDDLKSQLELMKPLLDEVEQINQAIKKGEKICNKSSMCEECGHEPATFMSNWCYGCLEEDAERYEEEEDKDYNDFDCSCGAWQWSEKEGKPIHIADCCCGSSEPW